MARLWIKTVRGEMHDDPIVYSIRNANSLTCILAMAGLTMVAQFVALKLFWAGLSRRRAWRSG